MEFKQPSGFSEEKKQTAKNFDTKATPRDISKSPGELEALKKENFRKNKN